MFRGYLLFPPSVWSMLKMQIACVFHILVPVSQTILHNITEGGQIIQNTIDTRIIIYRKIIRHTFVPRQSHLLS
jgi:hypothetical protein